MEGQALEVEEGRQQLRTRLLELHRVLRDTYTQLDRLEEEQGEGGSPLEAPGAQREQRDNQEQQQDSEEQARRFQEEAATARNILASSLRLSRQVARMRLTLLKRDLEIELFATAKRLADSCEADSAGGASSTERTRTDEGLPSTSSAASSSRRPASEISVVYEASRKQRAGTSGRRVTRASAAAARLQPAGGPSLGEDRMLISATEESRAGGRRVDSSHSSTPPSEVIIPSTAAVDTVPTHSVHFHVDRASVAEAFTVPRDPRPAADSSGSSSPDPQEVIVSELAEEFTGLSLVGAGLNREGTPTDDSPNCEDETEDLLSPDTQSQVAVAREKEGQSEAGISTEREGGEYSYQPVNTDYKTVSDSSRVTNEAAAAVEGTRGRHSSPQRRKTGRSAKQKTPSRARISHSPQGVEDSKKIRTRATTYGSSASSVKVESSGTRPPDLRPAIKRSASAGVPSQVVPSSTSQTAKKRQATPATTLSSSQQGMQDTHRRRTRLKTSPQSVQEGKTSSKALSHPQKDVDDSLSVRRRSKAMHRLVSPSGMGEAGGTEPPGEVTAKHGSLCKPEKKSPREPCHSDGEMDSPAAHTRFKFMNVSSIAQRAERNKELEVATLTSTGNVSEVDTFSSTVKAEAIKTPGEVFVMPNRQPKPEEKSSANPYQSEVDSPAAHTRFKFMNVSSIAQRAERNKELEVATLTSTGNVSEVDTFSSTVKAEAIKTPGEVFVMPNRQPKPEEQSAANPYQSEVDSPAAHTRFKFMNVSSIAQRAERNKELEVAMLTSTGNLSQVDTFKSTVKAEATNTPGEVFVKPNRQPKPEEKSSANPYHSDSEVDTPAAHTRFKFMNVSSIAQRAERNKELEVAKLTSTGNVSQVDTFQSTVKAEATNTPGEVFVKPNRQPKPEKKSSANPYHNDSEVDSPASHTRFKFMNVSSIARRVERNKELEVAMLTSTGNGNEVDIFQSTEQAEMTKTSGEMFVKPEEKSAANTCHSDSEVDSPAVHTRFKFLNVSSIAQRSESQTAPGQSVQVTGSTPGKRVRETSSSDDSKSANTQNKSRFGPRGGKSSSKEKLSGNKRKQESVFSVQYRKKSRRGFGSACRATGTNVRRVAPACSSSTRGTASSAGTRFKTRGYSGGLRSKVVKEHHHFSYSQSLSNMNDSASQSIRSKRLSL